MRGNGNGSGEIHWSEPPEMQCQSSRVWPLL